MRLLSFLLPTVAVAFLHVDTGTEFTCFELTDSSVRCSGLNDKGQFGDNTTTNSNVPVPGGLDSARGVRYYADLATGSTHACAFTAAGDLYCWGLDEEGQQGDGPVGGPAHTNFLSSFVVGGVSSVNLGHQHTCAVLSYAQTAWCWGRNLEGQVGVGHSTATDPVGYWTPQQVVTQSGSPITDVTAVSCGYKHSCALFVNQTVACWGDASDGILGVGVYNNTPYPVFVGLTDVVYVASGINIADSSSHACAIFEDSSLGCWGINNFRQLGWWSFTEAYSATAIMVRYADGSYMTNVIDVACGGRHTCAVLDDGTLWCWGENSWGQLGIGSYTNAIYPMQVNQTATIVFTNVLQVAASTAHTCVATSGVCSIYCWGSNAFGKLGIGIAANINQTRPRCTFFAPTNSPSSRAPTPKPTATPTYAPTQRPSTYAPAVQPSQNPTNNPTADPTAAPTPAPVWPTLADTQTTTTVSLTTTATGIPIPGYDGTYVLPCNGAYGPGSGVPQNAQVGPAWPVGQPQYCGFPGVPCLEENLFCWDYDPDSPTSTLACDTPAAGCGGTYRWFVDYNYVDYASNYNVTDAVTRARRYDRDFIRSGSSGNIVDPCELRTSTMPTSANPYGSAPFQSCLQPDGLIQFNVQSLCSADQGLTPVMVLCLLDPTSVGVCACSHSLKTTATTTTIATTSVDS